MVRCLSIEDIYGNKTNHHWLPSEGIVFGLSHSSIYFEIFHMLCVCRHVL